MVDLASRPLPRERVIVQRARETLLLLDLDAGTYFSLDEVGGRVWELCDGSRTVADVVRVVTEEFDAPADVIESDVVALLSDLAGERLLVVGP